MKSLTLKFLILNAFLSVGLTENLAFAQLSCESFFSIQSSKNTKSYSEFSEKMKDPEFRQNLMLPENTAPYEKNLREYIETQFQGAKNFRQIARTDFGMIYEGYVGELKVIAKKYPSSRELNRSTYFQESHEAYDAHAEQEIKNEEAAFNVSQATHLHVFPFGLKVIHEGHPWWIQVYVKFDDGFGNERDRIGPSLNLKGKVARTYNEWKLRALILSYLMGENDRHFGNFISDMSSGRVLRIDFGRSFMPKTAIPESFKSSPNRLENIPSLLSLWPAYDTKTTFRDVYWRDPRLFQNFLKLDPKSISPVFKDLVRAGADSDFLFRFLKLQSEIRQVMDESQVWMAPPF